MRALFLGKHKQSAVAALEHLVDQGVEVIGVVAPPDPGFAAEPQRLDLAAKRLGVALTTDEAVYAGIEDPRRTELPLDELDLVLSFLFWRRIRKPLIDLGRVGCINFHPAPLPDFGGLGGYNVALMERLREWGATAHFVDEDFDSGDLIKVERFPIDPDAETALSLDIATQSRLLTLFRDVVGAVLQGKELPRCRQQGGGRYVDRAEFEALRKVRPEDPPEVVARKIRAFWYPPHPGATVDLAGRTYTLVDDRILHEANRANQAAGVFP